jgi:hypothetical protein
MKNCTFIFLILLYTAIVLGSKLTALRLVLENDSEKSYVTQTQNCSNIHKVFTGNGRFIFSAKKVITSFESFFFIPESIRIYQISNYCAEDFFSPLESLKFISYLPRDPPSA